MYGAETKELCQHSYDNLVVVFEKQLLAKEKSVSMKLLFGYTASHRLGRGIGGGGGGGVMRRSMVDEEEKQGSSGGCEEGWLLSHNYCLLYTGLGDEQAEVFCTEQGANQARGICVKKPMGRSSPLTEGDDNEDDNSQAVENPAPSASSDSAHQCPAGWSQYKGYCFFKPGAVPEMCALLGANHIFNYCYTRIPHEISTDFLNAVKRLDGSEYDMHRTTRLCCCRGGGLCKK
ncbi:uncharacterized protein [Littorina saxatilis]|uniref:uncharacterized protein n=1 Tax=Littorina saxatilis TaxID=31220 RepID=UPI0038B56DE0